MRFFKSAPFFWIRRQDNAKFQFGDSIWFHMFLSLFHQSYVLVLSI